MIYRTHVTILYFFMAQNSNSLLYACPVTNQLVVLHVTFPVTISTTYNLQQKGCTVTNVVSASKTYSISLITRLINILTFYLCIKISS